MSPLISIARLNPNWNLIKYIDYNINAWKGLETKQLVEFDVHNGNRFQFTLKLRFLWIANKNSFERWKTESILSEALVFGVELGFDCHS